MKIAYFAVGQWDASLYAVIMQTYTWNDLTKQIISPEGMVAGTAETADEAFNALEHVYDEPLETDDLARPFASCRPFQVTFVCSLES